MIIPIDSIFPAGEWEACRDVSGYTVEKATQYMGPKETYTPYYKVEVVRDQSDAYTNGDIWSVKSGLFKFTVRHYPSCCGALMLHKFSVDGEFVPHINKEKLFDVWDQVLNHILTSDCYWVQNRRIMVVMVETAKTQEQIKDPRNLVSAEDPMISYPLFWEYFHSRHEVRSDRLFFNANTKKILHDLEVIIK